MGRASYPSDLSDSQWWRIQHYFPKRHRGRQAVHSRREMLNAVFYVLRTGCQWRMLPHDFPPWEAVYAFFSRLNRKGLWEIINRDLREEVREEEGKEAEASLLIVDSQSVQTAEKRGSVAMMPTKTAKALNVKSS